MAYPKHFNHDEICRIARENPHLTASQVGALVGCTRQTVWGVLRHHEQGNKQSLVRLKRSAVSKPYSAQKETYMVSVIRKHAGKSSIPVMADLCGCARSTIWRLMKKHGIEHTFKGGRPKGWRKYRGLKTTLIGEL